MLNSPISALATGLIASQRLDNVPNAESFRNNFFLSSLLCGNAAAQMVFNMRTADDLAEVLKDRSELQKRVAMHKFAILNWPSFTGVPEVGQKLTAKSGQYEGAGSANKVGSQWFVDENPLNRENEFTPEAAHSGRNVTLREVFITSDGTVTVSSPAVVVQPAPAAAVAQGGQQVAPQQQAQGGQKGPNP